MNESALPLLLVADADEDTCALYQHSGTAAGWDVIAAADGRDALVAALTQRPALIITEIRLPLLDGLAFCEIVRRDPATAKTPIAVVTAETRPAQLARARQAGANIVLVKPIPLDDVLTEMHRVIEAAHAGPPPIGRIGAAPNADAFALARSHRPRMQSRSLRRHTTTTPPAPPPSLVCPLCDGRLVYECSHVGGVNEKQLEQWDHFACAACGAFQYRHRTRALRRVS